jgi:hypothetical protein
MVCPCGCWWSTFDPAKTSSLMLPRTTTDSPAKDGGCWHQTSWVRKSYPSDLTASQRRHRRPSSAFDMPLECNSYPAGWRIPRELHDSFHRVVAQSSRPLKRVRGTRWSSDHGIGTVLCAVQRGLWPHSPGCIDLVRQHGNPMFAHVDSPAACILVRPR